MSSLPLLSQSSRTLRLGTTGSIILGAAAGASAANATNGTVVYNDSPGISAAELRPSGTANFVYFDITGDGTEDLLINSMGIGKSSIGLLGPDLDAPALMHLNAGEPLAFGSIVGPELGFLQFTGQPGDTSVTGATLSAGESYYGFSFTDGSTNYGWIQVSYLSKTVTVLGWAYDTSGASIAVGATASAIPEPATTTLAMGAFALLAGSAAAWRRRKARMPAVV